MRLGLALGADDTPRSSGRVEDAVAAPGRGGRRPAARAGRASTAPAPPEPITLRWIFAHMIEEYARHNGHADLIRQSIDGQVGDA